MNIKDLINKKYLKIIVLTLVFIFGINLKNVNAAPPYPVKVTDIRFLNGIGRGPTSSGTDNISIYFRGYDLPGTLIEITADMNNGSWGAPMYGNVMFTVAYTDGTNTGTFNITLPSGSHTVAVPVPYDFNPSWIASGTTMAWTYTVTLATGDYVENSGLPASIISSTSQIINWDRNDPPSSGTPAITVNKKVISATSLTVYWTPIDTAIDQDFYEYRIYYREENTSTYKQWNSTHDSTLGGLGNNPAILMDDTLRHFETINIASSGLPVMQLCKYTTIPNLKLFTGYEFYITAVDVFGNEISADDAGPSPAGGPTDLTPRLIRTLPLQVEAAISDSITSYNDFTDLTNPSLRTLREVNTRVDVYTVSAVTQPDECIIWFTTTNAPASDSEDIVTPLLTTNTAIGADLDSVSAIRTGPNVWTAYLPTIPSTGKNKIITTGNNIRFIVELKNRGISTFVDRDSGISANNAEWTYAIGTAVKVTPWPVRILNNVLTKTNPRAYPSYYLTEDAYVTIRIYDVKGRPVAVLLESAFRRGGQNIKEEGWAGSNKSGQKLGVGLYYVHINAKSASRGSVILDSFKKVVMRH